MMKIIAILALLGASLEGVLAFQSAGMRRSTLRGLAMSGEFTLGILGDLHLDPRDMSDHHDGREHFLPILKKKDGSPRKNCAVVSLGDLGESKACEPNTAELFAGTSRCHKLAAEYLGGFGVPFEVVGGNHDLEGIDEFPTDQANLEAYLEILGKETAQFSRLIAEKTLLVGLGSTSFRTAQFTSHEVCIDDEQIEWFKKTIADHPASEGWRVFVFSHAPPMGSGLRVLQENHVVNGCCWLNHNQESASTFIDVVRKNACIKAWFSGHFHLGQDYQDSITFPEGNNRGSCVFAQTAVMAKKSTRDTRRQSRMIRGTNDGFNIYTIDHTDNGRERLDATVTYNGNDGESVVFAHPSDDYDHDAFFSAYTPQEEDGCYLANADGVLATVDEAAETVCWWHMSTGQVLGVHNGMVLEYDPSTLAPLGLVVGKDELSGRKVAVVDSGIETLDNGEYEKIEHREQAVILYDEEGHVTVVQPNEDGSYWRKIVRNKVVRMKEKRREDAAKKFLKTELGLEPDAKVDIKSTWGPYMSTSGTAKKTTVPGVTSRERAKV